MAEQKRITCPETGHLEEVELEHTPLGFIVTGCSRFRDGHRACPRECARRLDCRDHINVEDRDRVVLVLANLHDEASHLAKTLADELAAEGLTIEIADLGARAVPPLADYDAVVIGARVKRGRHDRRVTDYIRDNVTNLATLPAFFYSVGGYQKLPWGSEWQPTATWRFVDAGASRRADIRAFGRRIADEMPAALQPSLV